jgi:hypothetical protein
MVNNLRMLLAFTFFAVCAASSAAWFAYSVARSSLDDAARTSLTLGREVKRRQVERFFAQLQEHIAFDASQIRGLSRGELNLSSLSPRHLGVEKRILVSCTASFEALPKTAAQAIMEVCRGENPGRVVLTDFSIDKNQPVAFLAAAIAHGRSSSPVSVLLYEIESSALNRMMLAAESWEREGFGRTGETYIVGKDFLMRTNSRFAVEGLDGLLERLRGANNSPDIIARIQETHSTVLALPVRSVAAQAGLSGQTGTGILRDYRNIEVLSSFAPLKIPGVDWAILSEIDVG